MSERYVGFLVKNNVFSGEIEIMKTIDSFDLDRMIIPESLITKAADKLKETVKTKEFFSVSGILICINCMAKKPEFADILLMTKDEMEATGNAYIPDVTEFFTDVPQVVFMCSECKITWSKVV